MLWFLNVFSKHLCAVMFSLLLFFWATEEYEGPTYDLILT